MAVGGRGGGGASRDNDLDARARLDGASKDASLVLSYPHSQKQKAVEPSRLLVKPHPNRSRTRAFGQKRDISKAMDRSVPANGPGRTR